MARRVSLTLMFLVALTAAAPAGAQTGRASGTVRDTSGDAVKGATIRAVNPEAYPPQIVSTSDDKGRWAMVGLRGGTWRFVAEAPGFHPVEAEMLVRTAGMPPLRFTLARDPGPIPGALPANIQAQIAAAHMLRDQGRIDAALDAYRTIAERNPKLTMVNLVLGQAYRAKASQESDPAARRALLDRAIDAYGEVLAADAEHAAARAELAAARVDAQR